MAEQRLGPAKAGRGLPHRGHREDQEETGLGERLQQPADQIPTPVPLPGPQPHTGGRAEHRGQAQPDKPMPVEELDQRRVGHDQVPGGDDEPDPRHDARMGSSGAEVFKGQSTGGGNGESAQREQPGQRGPPGDRQTRTRKRCTDEGAGHARKAALGPLLEPDEHAGEDDQVGRVEQWPELPLPGGQHAGHRRHPSLTRR